MALATPPATAGDRQTRAAVVLGAVLVATLALSLVSDGLQNRPTVQLWTTMFVAVCVQAMPFLVLGVTVGGLIDALVPMGAVNRLLPRSPVLAVPAAAVAGVALPGCECSSVPVAGRLIDRGAPAPAALAFLLASPAINPVVLVATAVAFPGRPDMVLARFAASLAAAVVIGWVWARFATGDLADLARARRDRRVGHDHDHDHGGGTGIEPGRMARFFAAAHHDLLHAGGFLVLGAAMTATLHTIVPRSVLDAVADNAVVSVAALAALAVVLALCSEADGFIAASLSQFSLTSRLAFLVVGPMVDVKLVALQAGTFGRRFAVRFAPLTFVVAVTSAVVTAWVVL